MERTASPKAALLEAVSIAGSQSELARRCKTYHARIHRMITAGRTSAEYVLAMEAATGVSRHDLRPDLYPREGAIAQVLGPSSYSELGKITLPVDVQEARHA